MKIDMKTSIAFLAAVLAASGSSSAADIEVSQKGKSFMQDKSPVQSIRVHAGDTVSFRNDDPFFHNIYSASPEKSFDLGSYPQGQSRKVTFEKPGTVEVQCAIHPEMKLKVEVVK